MTEFDIIQTAVAVRLIFKCPVCGHEVSGEIDIPDPDYSAETGDDSMATNDDNIMCNSCNELFNVEIVNTYNGGYGKLYVDANSDISIEHLL